MPGFSVHRDLGLGPLQPVGPVEGCELATPIGVYDLGQTELLDCLVQCLKAELGLQRVRYPLGQNLSGKPVHDGDQLQKLLSHQQVGDIGAPDLIGPIDLQPTQQLGLSLLPLRGLAGVGLLIGLHQLHWAHQSPVALLIHGMTFVLKVPSHLSGTVKGETKIACRPSAS
jgi:hypothetical protein